MQLKTIDDNETFNGQETLHLIFAEGIKMWLKLSYKALPKKVQKLTSNPKRIEVIAEIVPVLLQRFLCWRISHVVVSTNANERYTGVEFFENLLKILNLWIVILFPRKSVHQVTTNHKEPWFR